MRVIPRVTAALALIVVLGPSGCAGAATRRGDAETARGALEWRTRAAPLDGAVMYGMVPRLYGEPPLQAATRALANVADLGADVVWLSPVFAAPPGDFGYAVVDPHSINGALGTEDDLRAFIDEAHRRGMRVVLDLVLNHMSAKSPYFEDAAARGIESPYFGFFARDESGTPTYYFDWKHLPNLDYGNGSVQNWMLGVSTRWIGTGADGFRLDAAWGIRERAPAFWDRFATEVRRIRADAILVAEASARDPFYGDHAFDAAYDWTDEPGRWAWDGVFDVPKKAPDRLHDALSATAGARGLTRVLRFLENNDTHERFVTRYGVGMTRVAAAALLTLPGVPCLFSGQEVGAEYDPYYTADPIIDEDRHGLRAWYKQLIALRRMRRSLRSETWARAQTPPGSAVYAYARSDPFSGETTLVALNFDEHPTDLELPLPAGVARASAWRDLLTGARAGATPSAVQVRLPGWGVAILAPGS
jgi:glycosidase